MSHDGDMVCTEFSRPISVTEREGNLYTIIHKSKEKNFHKALNILNCSYVHSQGISQYTRLLKQQLPIDLNQRKERGNPVPNLVL